MVNSWARFDDNLIRIAEKIATDVARRPYEESAVFAPPPCVFTEKTKATEANVAFCPAIAVDLDVRPSESLVLLEQVLGTPTLIVASEVYGRRRKATMEPKLHLYWRLRAPAVSREDLALSSQAYPCWSLAPCRWRRDCRLSVVHPLRWPGSWHTKSQPAQLCRIVGGDKTCEVDLSSALDAIETALRAAGKDIDERQSGHRDEAPQGFKTDRALSEKDASGRASHPQQ